MAFLTPKGVAVPMVTAEQMRLVDRIAVEQFHLGILQMMENAGRSLAEWVMPELGNAPAPVCVLAGSGGNGGGICCARHLHNHGIEIYLAISKPARKIGAEAANQLSILQRTGIKALPDDELIGAIQSSTIVIDALIGYGLRAAPRGKAATMISLCNRYAKRVISLDVPSGLDATSGAAPGEVVRPDIILTLALPKAGLSGMNAQIYLADIGIPPELYAELGLNYRSIFGMNYCIPLMQSRD